ncbi:MAG: hypothetical protein A3K59_02490 [Euryarchaeota archaeon RBG_19FT_COMBO_69_17]|nr:MAG: hypothetical protein A3K59_02490 [Euryarchaeota archaeon RBG_19FT_COMBO_69_17]
MRTMYCSACGAKNEDDATFCDGCGADLRAAPRPTAGSSGPGPLPVFYPPARARAWWYPIGVWLILSSFFLFVDLATTGGITWAYWPIGIIGIFMVGFPLLNLLEARIAGRR